MKKGRPLKDDSARLAAAEHADDRPVKRVKANSIKSARADPVEKCIDDVIQVLCGCKNEVISLSPLITGPVTPPSGQKMVVSVKTVNVVGSFANKSMLSNGRIDLFVELEHLYCEKDEFNYSLFFKFQSAADHLIRFLGASVESMTWDGVAEFSLNHRFTLTCVTDIPKMHRMCPTRSNITVEIVNSLTGIMPDSTPHYNALLLKSHVWRQIDGFIHLDETDRHVMKMMKAWMQKMKFGVTGLQATILYCHFKKSMAVNDAMQIFKAFLTFLQLFDWKRVTYLGNIFDDHALPKEYKDVFATRAFHGAYQVSVIDPSGVCNLFSRVTLENAKAFSWFCGHLLISLNSKLPFNMEDLLMKPVSDLECFDLLVPVNLTACVLTKHDIVHSIDNLGIVNRTVDIVRQAVHDRVHLIVGCMSRDGFILKVKLNQDNCFRLVDMGPLPDAPADTVKAFKQVWGDKAELRKFDGGIVRWAAAWPQLAGKRHLIMKSIIAHLFKHHQISDKISCVLCEQLDPLIEPKKLAVQPFSRFINTFDDLSKILRGMPEFPLGIVQILPISSSLRYTAVFPILIEPKVAGRSAPLCEAILIFERSSQWPNDLQALKAAKLAFLVQIWKILESQQSIPCSVNVESDFIDIFYQQIVFRFFIRVEKEGLLLKSHDDHEYAAWNHFNENKPLFHAKIHSMSIKYPCFGPTVRIVKRWIACQLFSFVDEELIEAVCAIVFSHSDCPNSVVSGFYRAILFISEHLQNTPFVFDPDHSLSSDTLSDIFKDSSSSLYCSFLKHGRYQLITQPTDQEWKYLRQIAKATIVMLDEALSAEDVNDIVDELTNPVLLSRLHAYHIRPNLSNSILSKRGDKKADENVDRVVRKSAAPMSDFMKSIPGLLLIDAVAERINRMYGKNCFYDRFEGSFIAMDVDGVEELKELQ